MADHGGDARPDPRKTAKAREAPKRNQVPSLLVDLLGDPLDPGYAEAAARPARPGRRRTILYAVVGALIAGGILGVAARVTDANAAGAESTRQALLADIGTAQRAGAELEASAAALAEEVRQANAAAGHGGDDDLEVAGGAVSVTGPALQVVIDAPAGDNGGAVILDRDIQLLVNGLWSAGAEAITVGGVRLRPTSTIRKAGDAILVDNKPVFWPLEIVAIGSPTTMAADFAGTSGYGRFHSFASLYDVQFGVNQLGQVTLPAAPGPVLRYGRVPSTTSAVSTEPTLPTLPTRPTG